MDLIAEAYGTDSDVCDVCNLATRKYKCPACGNKACSLNCVKEHKKNGCTGLRSKTHYVNMKHYSEQDFRSDIAFLEDMTRQRDNIARYREMSTSASQIRNSRTLSVRCKVLLKQARQRRIRLYLLPNGMSRNVQNKSFYQSR
jgi:hypothetical protein